MVTVRRAPAGIAYPISIQLLLDAEWLPAPLCMLPDLPRSASAGRGFWTVATLRLKH